MTKSAETRKNLDVVVFGLLVADILGRPVDLKRLPKPGSLQLIDTIAFSKGGNAANVGVALTKLGVKVSTGFASAMKEHSTNAQVIYPANP